MSQGMHPQQFIQQQQANQNTGPTIQQLKNKMSRGDLKSQLQQQQQQQREPTPRSHTSQDPDSSRRMTTRDDSSNGRYTAAQSNRGSGDAYDNGNGYDADSSWLVDASVDSYHHEDDQYWFSVRVDYSNGVTRNLSRLYEDFYNFHIALLEEFPVESGRVGDQPRILPFMPIPLQVVTDTVTASRRADLDGYVKELCGLPARISQHPLVDQLFALREGDTETPTGASGNGALSPSIGRSTPSTNMFHSPTSSYNTDRRPSASGGPRAVFASKAQPPSGNASPSLRSQASFATSPLSSGASEEMIKLKISYQEDIMAMRIPVSITFRSLQQKIFERVNTDQKELSYRDDRGDFARIQDDADNQLDPIIIVIMTAEMISTDAPIQDHLAAYIDALRGDEAETLAKETTVLVGYNKVDNAVNVFSLSLLILPNSDKATLEAVLKILITEPTQKTPLKFKTDNGLDEEETLRKIRLLSLGSLGSENLSRDLSYKDIAKALEVDEDHVELWAIDVIRAGLVEAKLNQASKVRLNGWRQSLAEILQVLANAKLTSVAVSTAAITNN
ncbi:bud emergence protein 1 [Mortierella sp. AD011]|nr:bud emergence protein 1 [Mortierella sp. AD011]